VAARLAWRDAGIRGVLVRDAVTGDVLTIARGNTAEVHTPGRSVDVTVSDGVRSRTRRVTLH
jgi:hypothetical protein